jgi:hypothetical protein
MKNLSVPKALRAIEEKTNKDKISIMVTPAQQRH